MMRWMWDTQDLWIDPARLVQGKGSHKFSGTAGNDVLAGTGDRDKFDLSQGGDDSVRGKGGDDTFIFDGAFTHDDVVNGGDGSDRIIIAGHYSGTIELDSNQLKRVEGVRFEGGASLQYSVMIDGGFTDLRLDGRSGGRLQVDASNILTGSVRVIGSSVSDVITGGSLGDRIYARSGGDILTGGQGKDVFVYRSISDSEDHFSPFGADTITDFSTADVILLPTKSGGVEKYHIGETAERVGDVLAFFDESNGRTTVSIFTDGDDIADMTIFLSGNRGNLEINHQTHIVLG